jgi:two-component system sensor histidine kinase MtrB
VLTTIGTVTAVLLDKELDREELRRLDELKSSFIALASHELRTPAAVVHGTAATLFRRAGELSAAQDSELRLLLYEQTERLKQLVEQLLDLSRLEAGAARIRPERFPVRRRVEELLPGIAGERTEDVKIEVGPELEAIADTEAFDRILSNLVANALRHGAPPVRVRAGRENGHLHVSVEDSGEGVPPDFVPRLFGRFARAGDGHRSGAGLGLAIAQSYAHAHGGELRYDHGHSHGARFELVLPADQGAGDGNGSGA